mmetsp:Transcript_64199/g.188405  ORF Transcript_64199/g.188405 Transcript_64199/m.188405 type:complete len:201 (-) Transcript_64199:284-886(-)
MNYEGYRCLESGPSLTWPHDLDQAVFDGREWGCPDHGPAYRVGAACPLVSHFGGVPPVPSRRVAMHFSTFLRSVCTAFESSKFVNHTSNRMTFAARGPESLSTRRRPVIMLAGSIVAPIMPSTRLFQYSSTCPPPMLGFSWNWKCPPLAFILSSHSGRMFSRKIMMASITWSPSGCSRTMRFCSRSSLGCGMWFQSFQKP